MQQNNVLRTMYNVELYKFNLGTNIFFEVSKGLQVGGGLGQAAKPKAGVGFKPKKFNLAKVHIIKK